MNDYSSDFENIEPDEIYEDLEKILFNYMPVAYSDQTVEVLHHIKNKLGCSINLLSNTGFIKGKSLRKVLQELGMAKYFDFQIYSDEVGYSKPNPEIFSCLIQTIREKQLFGDFSLNEIIHIGDNPLADIEGANKFGLSSRLINSNDDQIINLIDA